MLFDVSDIEFPPIVFFSLTGRHTFILIQSESFFNSSVNLFPTTRLSRGFSLYQKQASPFCGEAFPFFSEIFRIFQIRYSLRQIFLNNFLSRSSAPAPVITAYCGSAHVRTRISSFRERYSAAYGSFATPPERYKPFLFTAAATSAGNPFST